MDIYTLFSSFSSSKGIVIVVFLGIVVFPGNDQVGELTWASAMRDMVDMRFVVLTR
jgi:hypothetical protein